MRQNPVIGCTRKFEMGDGIGCSVKRKSIQTTQWVGICIYRSGSPDNVSAFDCYRDPRIALYIYTQPRRPCKGAWSIRTQPGIYFQSLLALNIARRSNSKVLFQGNSPCHYQLYDRDYYRTSCIPKSPFSSKNAKLVLS